MDADQQVGVEPTLSYDENVPYEEQYSTNPSAAPPRSALVNRIGHTKLYLLSELSAPRGAKHENAEGSDGDVEMEEDEDLLYRPNALLFQGSPISHLPTDRLFAYATHFDARPMGLEWIDDNTCVFVFETNTAAREAQRHLQKSAAEDVDIDGFITAKPIPVALWPPEERIQNSLGKGEGLKGVIRMRWARADDVKKKGAKNMSEFYKKHGSAAGKELFADREGRPEKKRRRNSVDDALQKARLDEELDGFLESDEELKPPSPPSKMRADHIANDGRTLLQRTSGMRIHPTTLADRITAPLPRRTTRGGDGRRRRDGMDILERGPRPRTDARRPKMSQQELDDELEAFLRERD